MLVALVVLSVGLLGLAALQSTAAQFNAEAYMRSQATVLAYDIADRIRGESRSGAGNGDYDSAFAGALPPACNDVVAAARSRKQDLAAWRRALACSLPSGNGAGRVGRMPREILTITRAMGRDQPRARHADSPKNS